MSLVQAGRTGYIMALDVGDKRIGVALAHSIARLPRPLTTLEHTATILNDIVALAAVEQIVIIIVGLPRGMDGGYTAQTRSAEAFKQKLEKVVNQPVYLVDETLTSVQAEAVLKAEGKPHSKGDIDAYAACFILETFFTDTSLFSTGEKL